MISRQTEGTFDVESEATPRSCRWRRCHAAAENQLALDCSSSSLLVRLGELQPHSFAN